MSQERNALITPQPSTIGIATCERWHLAQDPEPDGDPRVLRATARVCPLQQHLTHTPQASRPRGSASHSATLSLTLSLTPPGRGFAPSASECHGHYFKLNLTMR
jgi:hypothetical protein